MPQAAMLYARLICCFTMTHNSLGFNAASGNAIRATFLFHLVNLIHCSFNAASGNAIRATSVLTFCSFLPVLVSMPQAAMLYARLQIAWMKQRMSSVSMPQAAMLYARLAGAGHDTKKYGRFNAASGNAIRATCGCFICLLIDLEFQCRKRQCYTRDDSPAGLSGGHCWFQCRKRQCYTRDKKLISEEQGKMLVSMPQAAMLYARPQLRIAKVENKRCFNAASGNAIRATGMLMTAGISVRWFQCRKRQCYTRDSVSRSPRIYWAQTEIFTTFPFSHRKEAIFRGHRVFKISENIMSALDFQWLIVSTIFCCNLPRFSGQKRKNYF